MAEATRSGLKSRVRENRTPGSVRGRLGNWPSYRDAGGWLSRHSPLPPGHPARVRRFAAAGRWA